MQAKLEVEKAKNFSLLNHLLKDDDEIDQGYMTEPLVETKRPPSGRTRKGSTTRKKAPALYELKSMNNHRNSTMNSDLDSVNYAYRTSTEGFKAVKTLAPVVA